jgi:hypothetical protein
VRLDPAGASCTTGCALANAPRSCATGIDKCVLPGMCAAAETCGNNLDDDCNGRVDECTCFRRDADRDGFCEPGPCQSAMSAGPDQVPASSCVDTEPSSCDADPSRHPGARPRCGTDTDCDGNRWEGCAACEHSSGPFTWSCYRRTTAHCAQIHEAADPNTWNDNFLCTKTALGLRWSSAGPIRGMRCTRIFENAEPAGHTWNDNWLCLPADSTYELRWSEAGRVLGWSCVQWDEPADPHAWSDNFLCWRARPKPVCPSNDPDCRVCPGSAELCCYKDEGPVCATRAICNMMKRPGATCGLRPIEP